MSKPAAFQATYSDWKLVRTRKVVQIVFEVPVEAADAAYQVVGGMPNAGTEAWFAIARLNADATPIASAREGLANMVPATPPASSSGAGPEARAEDTPKVSAAAPPCPPEKERRRFDTLPLQQQAALLCADPVFQRYLDERRIWPGCATEDQAAEAVRQLCRINSRSKLQSDSIAGKWFIRTREQFLAWKALAA